MQALAKSPPIIGFKKNQAVRDVILVEKIVELAAIIHARVVVARGCAAPHEVTWVPLRALLPPHDESAHDHFTHAWQLGERLPQPHGGHFQNLTFTRFAAHACQRSRAREHPDLTDEIARAGRREDLLLAVARLKYFLQLATHDDDERGRSRCPARNISSPRRTFRREPSGSSIASWLSSSLGKAMLSVSR